ncbi:MAG: VWA domain-containing protein [Deltaproteobacteria bacterium]|nr:VWA domain-containing protein [Deltaproteobacteria bacterium]
MIRNSMRSTRLLSWRCLRWAIAIPALPLILWACASHPLAQPDPAPEMQTDVYISVAPNRQLDLVFMVDNSPSMAPKVEKMNAQLTKLIVALKDPNDGTLPDLRVALITSDLGTGGAYPSGSCAAKTLPDGTNSPFGDLGRFQMLDSPQDCQFDSGALFLEYKAGSPVNYPANADINQVFACLASNLGTLGCGEEHPLQAFEFALAARGVGNEEQQQKFLRGSAYLGLVMLTDEDDCSAAMNMGLFGDKLELRAESASLRCATRGHECGGRRLADQGDDSVPGYPTEHAYKHAFNDCKAREDTCPNTTDGDAEGTDTSVPTSCAPLKNISHLADEIRALKSDPDNQILVAGIFGWPLTEDDLAKAQYKIDMVPNPNTADTLHPEVWDYWPICYDPDHFSPSDWDTFNVAHAGVGAMGGLRIKAFIDEFGENGLAFSICERDFSKSMQVIGDAIAKKLQNLCVDYKLVDTQPDEPGVQADCRVVWRTPYPDPKDPTKVLYQEDPNSLPQCEPGATSGNVPEDCWQLTTDDVKCPVNGQLINVLRTAAHIAESKQLPPGTKVGMQCRTCTDFSETLCENAPNSPACRGCSYDL